MANIIYYLGAGASADALPTVADMADRLGLFAFALDKNCMDLAKSQEGLDEHRVHYKIYELQEFIDELKKRRSIDTYAKELHIRSEKKEIERLKKILYFYLNWEEIFTDDILSIGLSSPQYNPYNRLPRDDNLTMNERLGDGENIFYDYYKNFLISLKGNKDINIKDTLKLKKERIDQRYVNFLIDILSPGDTPSKPKFPKDNIKIISWNYDNQIELACDALQLSEDFFKDDIEKSNLITLNGRCDSKNLISKCDFKNFISDDGSQNLASGNDSENKILKIAYRASMNTLAFAFRNAMASETHAQSQKITFAWEHENKDTKERYYDNFLTFGAYGRKAHIVVVGYSFPFANRDTDADILSKLIEYYKKKYEPFKLDIHIQVPKEDEFKNIEGRIRSLLSTWISIDEATTAPTASKRINFYHQTDIKNFFIPSDL